MQIIEKSWNSTLESEFEKPYFKELVKFLATEDQKYTIYPPQEKIFSAFQHTAFNAIKVVIIGQDPYHGKGQANGLAFSVTGGIKLPPSLKNIFKELKNDTGIDNRNGDLTHWAKQGVFLLNATLTVRESSPGSHQQKGWEQFTDTIIKMINEKRSDVVFLLWGKFAQEKANLIDPKKHYILKAPHPSPFSAHQGFFGCKHFSMTNEYLRIHNKGTIDWFIREESILNFPE